jgi:hypothetical protein
LWDLEGEDLVVERVLGPHHVDVAGGEAQRIAFQVLGPGSAAGERQDRRAGGLVELMDREDPVARGEQAAAANRDTAVRATRRGGETVQQRTGRTEMVDVAGHVGALEDRVIAGIPGHPVADVRPGLSVEQEDRRAVRDAVERGDVDPIDSGSPGIST